MKKSDKIVDIIRENKCKHKFEDAEKFIEEVEDGERKYSRYNLIQRCIKCDELKRTSV